MLKGKCNQCGNCCFIGEFKCTNLVLVGAVGTPMASYCSVYAMRHTDMPITMKNKKGEMIQAYCAHNSELEDSILRELILENKCSLEV